MMINVSYVLVQLRIRTISSMNSPTLVVFGRKCLGGMRFIERWELESVKSN